MRGSLIPVAVLLFAACDARGPFVGDFSGTQALVVTNQSGQQSSLTSPWSAAISTRGSNLLEIATSACTLSATVDGTDYQLRATSCPSTQVAFDDGSACTQTVSYSQGTGTVDGDALDATHSGQTALSDCSDGFSGTFTFTETITAARDE